MMKRMIQFLLNCAFSRYFDSEFLEGKKKILQLPVVTNSIPASFRTDPCSRLLHLCFVLRELSTGAYYSLCFCLLPPVALSAPCAKV